MVCMHQFSCYVVYREPPHHTPSVNLDKKQVSKEIRLLLTISVLDFTQHNITS